MAKSEIVERDSKSFNRGDLKIYDGNGLPFVVVVTDPSGSDSGNFHGTVISGENPDRKIGDHHNDFIKNVFKPFNDVVKLYN